MTDNLRLRIADALQEHQAGYEEVVDGDHHFGGYADAVLTVVRPLLEAADAEAERLARMVDETDAVIARVRTMLASAPVMTHGNGYRVQAVPKADLLAALDGPGE